MSRSGERRKLPRRIGIKFNGGNANETTVYWARNQPAGDAGSCGVVGSASNVGACGGAEGRVPSAGAGCEIGGAGWKRDSGVCGRMFLGSAGSFSACEGGAAGDFGILRRER